MHSAIPRGVYTWNGGNQKRIGKTFTIIVEYRHKCNASNVGHKSGPASPALCLVSRC